MIMIENGAFGINVIADLGSGKKVLFTIEEDHENRSAALPAAGSLNDSQMQRYQQALEIVQMLVKFELKIVGTFPS